MRKITHQILPLLIFITGFNLNGQEKSRPVLLGDKFPEFNLLSNEGQQFR
jgi:hypothetical protein